MHRSQFWVLTHGWSSERLSIRFNLHSFVHITTFESLWGYITPHPALQKIFKRLPVLSFSVECLASCRTMMPYKLKTKIVQEARCPSMRPGANKKRPSWVPQRMHHLKNLKNNTTNDNQSVRKSVCWPVGLSRNHQKKKAITSNCISLFSRRLLSNGSTSQFFLLWRIPSSNPQTATQQPAIAASMVFSTMPQSTMGARREYVLTPTVYVLSLSGLRSTLDARLADFARVRMVTLQIHSMCGSSWWS